MKERYKENGTIFKLLSIDAWHDGEGWSWNNWFLIEDGIYLDNAYQTPRKIFAFLRKMGVLTEQSKGKLYLMDDQYNLVICNRSNGMPLLALEYGSLYEGENDDQ